MTTPICSAPRCGNPQLNGYLCGSCRNTLVDDLSAIPGLLSELDTTMARQDRLGDKSRRPGDERPLPFRVFAMEARRDVVQTLIIWALHVSRRSGHRPNLENLENPQKLARWMSSRIADIDSDPLAGTLADEIGYARVLGRRTIDKPAESLYAGPCDQCSSDLYAHPAAAEIECRDCAAAYRVETRRAWLLAQAEDHLLTAAEMSRALPGLLPHDQHGREQYLTAAMIRGWAHRGRLFKHPPHPTRPNDPLYRVGDVRTLANTIHQQQDIAS